MSKFTLRYPPTLHANIDVPYGEEVKFDPTPYFLKRSATAPKPPSYKKVEMDYPGVGRVTVDVNEEGFLFIKAEANVFWAAGTTRSWHEPDGRYLQRDYFPNFIATSGAQAWLAADGGFQNRGEGVPNYINSAGFALVLNADGSMRHLSALDVNGVMHVVDRKFLIAGLLDPPRIRKHKHPRAADEWVATLTYRVSASKSTAPQGVPKLYTRIAGSLAHPVFGSNAGNPNLLTGFTGDGASKDITFYHVVGFPFVRLNSWTYADKEDEVKTLHTATKPPRRELALHGKIAGKVPRKAVWSQTCENSNFGIMQVGGTCASTACLNILLCCPALRNYCIKVMNGFIDTQDLPGLARMAKWNTSRVIDSETLTETILHTIYKRMCGAVVTTPDVVSLAAVCLLEKTFDSTMYCGRRKIADSLLLLDILFAVGLDAGLLHPGLRKAIPAKKFDYAVVRANCAQAARVPGQPCVPMGMPNFTLVGAYIYLHFFTKKDPKATGAHAVAGIVCADGRRAVFDSNFGELDIDWVLQPVQLELHFLTKYASALKSFDLIALYFSNVFLAAHAAAVPCMSTSVMDKIVISHSVRDAERLCSLAEKLHESGRRPTSTADGSEVDTRYWRNVAE